MNIISLVGQQVAWQNSTFIFYLCIILGTYVLTLCSRTDYTIKITNKTFRINLGYFISALVLITIKSISLTGRDIQNGYYLDFLSASSLNNFRDNSIEFGFRILMILCHNIFNNYQIFIFIVGVLTTFPIFYLIWKYKKNIDVPTALLVYSSIFYFSGFSAMRFALAASIGLLAFDYFYNYKYKKALLYFIIVGSIHISVLVLALPLLLIFLKRLDKLVIVAFLIIMFITVFFKREAITVLLSSSSRYYTYKSAETVGFGLEQIAYYLPLFLLYYSVKKNDLNKRWQTLSFNILLTGFVFGLLSYVLPILGRLQYAFTPFILIISYYVKLLKRKLSNKLLYCSIINVSIILYCLFRFVLFITQYFSDQSLIPYYSIFGWSI